MRLLILNSPAGDDPAHADQLSRRFDVPVVAAGTLMATAGQDQPADDDAVNAAVAERLAYPDCRNGFILTGYPQTLHQLGAFDFLLAHDRLTLSAVLRFTSHGSGRPGGPGARGVTGAGPEPDAVADSYRRRGLLHDIDDIGNADSVHHQIQHALHLPVQSAPMGP